MLTSKKSPCAFYLQENFQTYHNSTHIPSKALHNFKTMDFNFFSVFHSYKHGAEISQIKTPIFIQLLPSKTNNVTQIIPTCPARVAILRKLVHCLKI